MITMNLVQATIRITKLKNLTMMKMVIVILSSAHKEILNSCMLTLTGGC